MKQRKQLKRFLCSIIFGILSVAACFSIPAYACTTAYYSWTWDARCIMQQGGSGFGTNTIQQHDENNMIAKWGHTNDNQKFDK